MRKCASGLSNVNRVGDDGYGAKSLGGEDDEFGEFGAFGARNVWTTKGMRVWTTEGTRVFGPRTARTGPRVLGAEGTRLGERGGCRG